MKKKYIIFCIVLIILLLFLLFFILEFCAFKNDIIGIVTSDGSIIEFNENKYLYIEIDASYDIEKRLGFIEQQDDSTLSVLNAFTRESIFTLKNDNNGYFLYRVTSNDDYSKGLYCLETYLPIFKHDSYEYKEIYAFNETIFDKQIFKYLDSIENTSIEKRVINLTGRIETIVLNAYCEDKIFYIPKGYIVRLDKGYYYVNYENQHHYNENGDVGYRIKEEYNDYLNKLFISMA